MSFQIPSAASLSQALAAGLKAAMPGSDPLIWPNNQYFIRKVIAQALRTLYGKLEYVRRQARVVTADGDALDDHGLDAGLTRNTATVALGDCDVPTTIGAFIPTQTQLVRADGVAFRTAGDYTAIAASTSIRVRAVDEGKAGNSEAGTVLTLVTPVVGVGSFVVDSDGLRGGAETETDQSFRQRILDRKRNPPHGGSPPEYIGWAREVAGVSRAFIQRAAPVPGSVTVVFMMDDIYFDGIPSPSDEAAVLAHLEDVAPSNVDIHVTGPVARPINITVSISPDTTETRAQVNAELGAMFHRKSQPSPPGGAFLFSKSWIDEAISTAPGEASHVLTVPSADVSITNTSSGALRLATLGTVTFV